MEVSISGIPRGGDGRTSLDFEFGPVIDLSFVLRYSF